MGKHQLTQASPEEVGISSRRLLEMVRKLERCGTEMHGLMITRRGKLILEGWWAPYTRETVHICHSFGKSYTATGIGAAVTDGLLSVDDRIVDLFAEDIARLGVPLTENRKELRVRHVLTMSNGMSVHAPSGEELVKNYLTTEVDQRPGSVFMYNTTGSCMLGEIVRRVTGRDLYAYIKARVFDRIGIDTDRLHWMRFRSGLHAAPGLASCTENNLRLAMLYLQGGRWDGEQVIDGEWIRQAVSKQIDNDLHGYGYQLWMHGAPGTFRFSGGHGQECFVSRPLELVVSINQGASEPHDFKAMSAILDAYLLTEPLPDSIPDDAEGVSMLRDYMGRRKLPDGASQPVHGLASGWEGVYTRAEGHFHLHPELRPMTEDNVYEDFYDCADPYVHAMRIRMKGDICEILLDDRMILHARLDGRRVPHETWCAMPAYRWEVSSVVFEGDQMIVDTWFYQTCFKTRMWLTRRDDQVLVRVRKDRLHDDRPYIWYDAILQKNS